ncbi:unnamed protein product [Symbiodinium sp. CCMP2592]|nr:unnamed protein product [Symbiodinium sp. CCMP2592]
MAQGCHWADICWQVVNLQGEAPSLSLVQRVHKAFNHRAGRRQYQYDKCGRKPFKVSVAVEKFLIKRLLALRLVSVCTAATLRRESTVRQVLRKHGYHWLPRTQKGKYSGKQKLERLRFAKAVLRLTQAQLREKLSFAMDGVILSVPPKNATDRENYIAQGETHLWRRRGEAYTEALAGQQPYAQQVPMDRVLPLWGGLSEGGFAVVTFHASRKLATTAWCGLVRAGRLRRAIQALDLVTKHGPWKVLCDNENAMAAEGLSAWRVPPSSPDLNPVEKMWAWLRRRIRQKDREDLRKRRPPPGKAAFKLRIRNMLASKTAQDVAARIAGSFRKTCRDVVARKGGMAKA